MTAERTVQSNHSYPQTKVLPFVARSDPFGYRTLFAEEPGRPDLAVAYCP